MSNAASIIEYTSGNNAGQVWVQSSYNKKFISYARRSKASWSGSTWVFSNSKIENVKKAVERCYGAKVIATIGRGCDHQSYHI